jgi:citrate synthase
MFESRRDIWIQGLSMSSSQLLFSTGAPDSSTNLKEVLAKKIPAHNTKVKEFRKVHGNTVVQQINIDMVRQSPPSILYRL